MEFSLHPVVRIAWFPFGAAASEGGFAGQASARREGREVQEALRVHAALIIGWSSLFSTLKFKRAVTCLVLPCDVILVSADKLIRSVAFHSQWLFIAGGFS